MLSKQLLSKTFSGILAGGFLLVAASANAVPVYLNESNISVAVGPGTTATSSNNTFNGGQTIDKVIDAPSADAEEFHNQTTHIWFSGAVGTGLELLFDFGEQYDLRTLHFWNYTGEGFDVDNIAFSFFDSTSELVGGLSIAPALGSSPGIAAQDIPLAAPLDVQFVTAFLTGSNGQVDFQNIGFTAELSTDRCETNPNDPICTEPPVEPPVEPPAEPPSSVPEPSTFGLLGLGLLALGFRRKRKRTV